MPFPKKSYFSLSEVSARWRRKIKDVEYCIENGLLSKHSYCFGSYIYTATASW